jgi:putative mRNA 3-end processing factor
MVLESGGRNLLFDYGMTPSKPPEVPMPPPPVDALFLTHAHIDHSGMVPRASSESRCPVHTTGLTAEVASILMDDTIKIARAEGYSEPYSEGDLRWAKDNFTGMEFGETERLDGVDVTAHKAGHIPGASMYAIDDGDKTVLFTGDINTIRTNLVAPTRPVACNTLVLESTYAGREHEPRHRTEKNFLAKVEEVVDRGGLAVVPAFAVGRTQEVVMLLERTGLEVWVDGMGKRVARMYMDSPEYLQDHRRLSRAFGKAQKVRSPATRERAMRGDVIVTTSGMLDGGPVLEYIGKLRKDPKSAILLTGYQVEGTNGRRLMEDRTMDFYGALQTVETELAFFDLSAHAGHSELVEFARGCAPERVVLCHGDNRGELASALEDDFEVLMPMEGETLEL